MSEYQYYEFQALDHRLTDKEMAELRARSSRAHITPTSFVNDYSWGSFKGDEDAWMERYFDAFLYLANWGTHILKLRLSERLLPKDTARLYASQNGLSVRSKNGHVVLSFHSEDENGGGWVEGEGQLAPLIPVRAELARGDLRALYLGWLLAVQSREIDDDVREPPVPPGLATLSGSQESLAEFLRVDRDLLAAAAAVSPPLEADAVDSSRVEKWVSRLPAAEKNELLTRVLTEDNGLLVLELKQRMQRETGRGESSAASRKPRRSVAELLTSAEQIAEERRRVAQEQAARDQAKQERDAAKARKKRLDALSGKEPALWREVEQLVATKQPKSYDRAIAIVGDLRGLAARGDGSDFALRLEAFRVAHQRKRTLIERLDELAPNDSGLGFVGVRRPGRRL